MQNYPNPFNPDTNIEYILPSKGRVLIKLFDLLGNEISVLQNTELPAGDYKIRLNAAEYNLSSGVYIYQVSFKDEKVFQKKAVYLR